MRDAMEHQRVGGKPTPSLAEGKTLRITIASVRGTDGGGWTGARVLSLDAALFENGRQIGQSHFTSETMSPRTRSTADVPTVAGSPSTSRGQSQATDGRATRASAAPTPTPVEGEAEQDAASGAAN